VTYADVSVLPRTEGTGLCLRLVMAEQTHPAAFLRL
jgi:hypothetical protein